MNRSWTLTRWKSNWLKIKLLKCSNIYSYLFSYDLWPLRLFAIIITFWTISNIEITLFVTSIKFSPIRKHLIDPSCPIRFFPSTLNGTRINNASPKKRNSYRTKIPNSIRQERWKEKRWSTYNWEKSMTPLLSHSIRGRVKSSIGTYDTRVSS